MKCEKHPKYNGIRWKKLRCEQCDTLYRKVRKETMSYGKYQSITTPESKCGIVHLICELSCIMLYGTLPPFFWLASSKSPPSIRKFFHDNKIMLEKRSGRDPEFFNDIENILYCTYVAHYKKQVAAKITGDVKTTEVEEIPTVVPIDLNIKSKVNKWSLLNE